jgi:hypothetical protein
MPAMFARRRLGAKTAQSITLFMPGTVEVEDALDLIKIYHTFRDAIVFDSRTVPVGRATFRLRSMPRHHVYWTPLWVQG